MTKKLSTEQKNLWIWARKIVKIQRKLDVLQQTIQKIQEDIDFDLAGPIDSRWDELEYGCKPNTTHS